MLGSRDVGQLSNYSTGFGACVCEDVDLCGVDKKSYRDEEFRAPRQFYCLVGRV